MTAGMEHAQMERPTREQTNAMRHRLSEWQTHGAMRSLIQEMHKPHGFYAVSQGNMQFWREAHCACQFASIVNAKAVRLSEIDPPDFQLDYRGQIVGCELVEVRDPNERIGDEFDSAAADHNAGIAPEIVHFNTEGHRTWLAPTLKSCVAKKAGKGYDRQLVLAVYIHAWIFDDQRRETDQAIFAAVLPHLDAFAEIWVLSSGRLLTFSQKMLDERTRT